MLPRRLTAALLTATALSCDDESAEPAPEPCPERDPGRSLQVAGVYRYASPIYLLRGTITFAQDGDRVRVVDTTYDNADDRRLAGEAALEGNHAAITLVPSNGDTDYSAEVEFVFEEDEFCVRSFSDTNLDVGGEGSYRGRRIAPVLPDAGSDGGS